MTGRIYLSPPHMGPDERELLLDAFDSNWIAPLGPHVAAFETEFAQVVKASHAAALSSGTAALHLAMIILGIGPGDEVLCPTLTFAATANAIRYVGATPVFIDSEAASWNMDPDLLEAELADCDRRGKRPAAVVSVDLYGQCCDYRAIVDICKRWDVPLIEDAAEALGATYDGKPAGSFGRLAAFSFNGNKIITCSGGGMLVSEDRAIVQRAIHLATQAREPAPHYQHEDIGYNYRLSNLLAAVGRGQLRHLASRVDARRDIRNRYLAQLGSLPGLAFMPEIDNGRSTFWLTACTIDADAFGASNDDVRKALEKANIEARPVWKPMHLQPVFSNCRHRGGDVAAQLFRDGLCLPSGSSLSDTDQQRIVAIVKQCGQA